MEREAEIRPKLIMEEKEDIHLLNKQLESLSITYRNSCCLINSLNIALAAKDKKLKSLTAQLEAQRRELEAARGVIQEARINQVCYFTSSMKRALAAYDKEVEDGRLPRNN